MLIVFFLLTQSYSPYIDSTLAYIGLSKKEITFRTDHTIPDPYRFSIVNELLSKPLQSINFVYTIENKLWHSTETELLENLIMLYELQIRGKKKNFKKDLEMSEKLIREAYLNVPQDIGEIFEDLIIFSPGLTNSIEEEKKSEKGYDSLVNFLKEHCLKVNYEKLFRASLILLSLSHDYSYWPINLNEAGEIDGLEGRALYHGRFDFGEIVVGDTGINIYKKDFAIIVDMGGDDIYQFEKQSGNFHILIDKSGNDLYTGEDYAIACGHFGVSIVIDEAGDDTYTAGSFSIGCGVFGIGILIDKQGNDRYTGDIFTQGAGGFGIGILKDKCGNDIYQGALYAQGFAKTYGIGILGDEDGNDMYITLKKYLDEIRYLDHYLSFSQGFSVGFRPDLSAGIGMIFDRKGNDYYLGDIFTQGSSYWYGIGALVDGSGNDNYVAYQYAQGSGTHLTIGLLIDKKGNDNYVSKGVSQGCGHDLSFGILYDHEGDDSYVAYDLSQGAGNANGIGMLIDESGDDTYSIKKTHNSQGYGDFRREHGSIGLLLDIKGKDSYRLGRDKSVWKNGKYGIGIDWE